MPDRKTLYRVASTFHENFNAGRFDDNGPLVAEDISVDSNTARLTGRAEFIARIKRFDGPFPGMQLRDRLILLDGNTAGVYYLMQGEHHGQFGDLAPTGRKVEVRGAEIFTFNDQAQMANLITVTELDRLRAQITGRATIAKHSAVEKTAIAPVSATEAATRRESVHQFYDHISSDEYGAASALVSENVVVQSGNDKVEGIASFGDYVRRHRTAFPDMKSHIQDVVVDGDHACASFYRRGTHHGDFTLLDGTVIAATGRTFSFRTIEFMHFNSQGLIDELTSVSNGDELVAQLQG